MNWIIWNKTKDKFWNDKDQSWSNKYYATLFSLEELGFLNTSKFYSSDDVILAVIAIHI